jgi:3',5'-cyclic AMP phosphodiesterase CpdA
VLLKQTHLSVCGLTAAFLASLVPSATAYGHEGHEHKPREVKPAEMYAPKITPDRVVLTWSSDPTTTQSVTWRTSTEVPAGLAEIALATAGPEFIKATSRVDAKTEKLITDINEAHFHSVTFKDLKPATKYVYRVGDGVNWSEWFQFRTASDKPEKFSFIYFGDAQNNLRSMWSRVIREAYSDAPKAAFIVHAGDLINSAESDAEWGEWFGAGNWLNGMIPNVPVPGNHEQAKASDGSRRISHHWRPSFTLFENGPEGLEETCFTFTYQNARIIGLNSNEGIEQQTVWMEEVLAKNEHPWVICTFHHPIFSTGKNRDNPGLREAWKPIFDKYRVDLVLTGHDHTYGRTGLQTPLKLDTLGNVPTGVSNVDTESGTIYVVSVSGPKMYDLDRKSFMVRTAEDTQLYQIIHVDGSELRFESRTALGELYDAFTLKKTKGEKNDLIEGEVTLPERRRK